MSPLYLTEQEVAELLAPADAIDAVEEALQRLARGSIESRSGSRLELDDGVYAVMASVDRELGYAAVEVVRVDGDAARRSWSCSSRSRPDPSRR